MSRKINHVCKILILFIPLCTQGHSAHSPVVVSSDSATDGSDDSESVKSITESLSENAPKPILLLGRRKR